MFTAKYGGGPPNPLFMKLPNGTQWKVIWENDNGEIWLREGWKEFVEHYSLDHEHFVFFEYEGTDHINVKICKQNGVKIDYPCGSGDGSYNLGENEEEPIIISDEEESPEQIGSKDSLFVCFVIFIFFHLTKFQDSSQNMSLTGLVRELHSKGERSVQRTSSLNQPNQTRAREVASNFISCNPFFTVVITPSQAMEYRLVGKS
ncbi:hypothetical protein V8G54_027445 [Vigna mungo]|uniref:TF-B3 domain-containing protein n=1 Tax=Vigna mungo TaxID=3915 RepID=A0AAQ3N2B8_VIGMU